MDNTTAELGGCKECGQQLVRKGAGPPPTYCSGRCRAKAGARRAKAAGRDRQWAAAAQAKRKAKQETNAKPCPYCGDLVANLRRVQCGKPECKKRFNVERVSRYNRQQRDETGRWPSQDVTYERTCEVCGTTWSTRLRLARYCSTSCTNKIRSYSLTCAICEAGFMSSQARTRWCSRGCAQRWREDQEQERRRTAWLPALPDWPYGRAWITLPDGHPARQYIPRPRVFIQGDCIRCGTAFCVQATRAAFYCSTKCLRADGKAKRRALQRNAYVAHVYRARIFKRDNWTCQLCNTETDRDQVAPHPKAPVIDHIVPLAKGGTHEPANVQCAHFMCNSIKSDRTGAAQFMLIGQPHEETDIGEGTWRGALALFRTPTGR